MYCDINSKNSISYKIYLTETLSVKRRINYMFLMELLKDPVKEVNILS